jgi:hypothetical protein
MTIADQVEAHRLPGLERRAALHADLAPAQHADENLKECHGDRQADPAEARKIDAGRQIGKIGLAQRKIKQRRRDQYLDCRKQDPTHLARARQV